jgi:hypothetical protein
LLWPKSRRAEVDDEEGDAVFGELRDEDIAKCFNEGRDNIQLIRWTARSSHHSEQASGRR